MRILFIGDAWLGSNARSLANGMQELGHEVVHIDTSGLNRPQRWSGPWVYSKFAKKRDPRIAERVHREIEAAHAELKPELVFCFKTIHLSQERLLALSNSFLMHYSADDVSNSYNTTEDYLRFEKFWDAVVTTKTHNVPELTARGVQNAIFVSSAYDPALHHPVARKGAAKSLVGFLGNKRPDREEVIRRLASVYGPSMAVGGPGWEKDSVVRSVGAVVSPAQYGEDLSYFVAGVCANLVLLNSDNRDTHTCRSFEVPAAGGLFVGERTTEHLQILDDGEECLMFSTQEELDSVLERVAGDPRGTASLASKGTRRIHSSRHTYADRAKEILFKAGLS